MKHYTEKARQRRAEFFENVVSKIKDMAVDMTIEQIYIVALHNDDQDIEEGNRSISFIHNLAHDLEAAINLTRLSAGLAVTIQQVEATATRQ